MKTVAEQTAMTGELAARVSPATLIRRDEPMAKHTTLRVGGPADVYIEPANRRPIWRLGFTRLCGEHGVKFFILGRGSNLLVRDGGFRGVVICLSSSGIFAGLKLTARASAAGAGAKQKERRGRGEARGLWAAWNFWKAFPAASAARCG
jgi:hypothetical protein